jgi:hypothetical protein
VPAGSYGSEAPGSDTPEITPVDKAIMRVDHEITPVDKEITAVDKSDRSVVVTGGTSVNGHDGAPT